MNKTTVADTVPKQDKDYEVAVEGLMTGIERNLADMAESQARIVRLRAETNAILTETRQALAKLAA